MLSEVSDSNGTNQPAAQKKNFPKATKPDGNATRVEGCYTNGRERGFSAEHTAWLGAEARQKSPQTLHAPLLPRRCTGFGKMAAALEGVAGQWRGVGLRAYP